MKLEKFVLEDFVKEPFMMKALFFYEDEVAIMGNLFYNSNTGFGIQLFDWKDDKFVTVGSVELELIKFYIPLD